MSPQGPLNSGLMLGGRRPDGRAVGGPEPGDGISEVGPQGKGERKGHRMDETERGRMRKKKDEKKFNSEQFLKPIKYVRHFSYTWNIT